MCTVDASTDDDSGIKLNNVALFPMSFKSRFLIKSSNFVKICILKRHVSPKAYLANIASLDSDYHLPSYNPLACEPSSFITIKKKQI